MAVWVAGAAKTRQVEFPAWEGMLSVGAFQLKAKPSETQVNENLDRLSHIFGGDLQALKEDCS